MTNVRDQRHNQSLPVLPFVAAVADHVVACLTKSLRAASSFAGVTVLAVAMLASTSASAQDLSYGRNAVGSAPSGSAGGTMVDSNRQGLGMTVRGGHFAGGTVGRNESASILGISPYISIGDGLLFGDSRFTYANDGGLAWSFGGGYRQYITAWDAIIGGYGYFDRDQISGAHFKQWSAGAELISQNWEFRANFYQPFDETSEQTASDIDINSVTFIDQNIQFTPINTFAEALEGYDAEFGVLFPGQFAERFDVRGFGGGYSYKGEGQPRFSGFSARLQADIADMLELGLKITDDEVFHTNVTFNAIVHFGGFNSQEHTQRSAIQRMAEPVRRNLNIASNISSVRGAPQIALKADGTPFVVAHVNSNAGVGGLGTVEQPFNSLQAGINSPTADIVFTHAGSSWDFATSPSEVTVALDGDKTLFGEGLVSFPSGTRLVDNVINLAEVGDLSLPLSPTFESNLATFGQDPTRTELFRPSITGSPGDAVTISGGTPTTHTRFGGFVINSPGGRGLFIDSVVGNTTVNDVEINTPGTSGIEILDSLQNTATTIRNTIINSTDTSTDPAFFVNGGAGNIGFNPSPRNLGLDPAYSHISNSGGAAVRVEGTLGGTLNMGGSTINDLNGTGIQVVGSTTGAAALGDVLIDNARIENSSANGILVSNVDANVTFQNSIRTATEVISAADVSVQIEQLGAGNSVSFQDLTITTPRNGGLSLNQIAGNFTFSNDLTIGAPDPTSAVAPAISATGNLASSRITFEQGVTVDGSTGQGIFLQGNEEGSNFTINGDLTLSNTAGNAIQISQNDGNTTFSGTPTNRVAIAGRLDQGIVITESNGPVRFAGQTTVLNTANVDATGVTINQNESVVSFNELNVTNALLGGGVILTNNGADVNGSAVAGSTGQITLNEVTIDSIGGVGLFGLNNDLIRIGSPTFLGGTITSQGAAAIDVEESGINMTFQSITSAGSPNWGIRLVETNKTLGKTFTTEGTLPLNLNPGSGGIISGANGAGVLLQNAGQVSLNGMVLDDNNFGVFMTNPNLVEEDNQFFRITESQILDSDRNGIFGQDSILIEIDDVLMDNNGDLATATGNDENGVLDPTDSLLTDRQTIELNYTQRLNEETTIRYTDDPNVFNLDIRNSNITDNTHDILQVRLDQLNATGAHLGVNLQNNIFVLNDGTDFSGNEHQGIDIEWNGPALVNITNNEFQLNGLAAGEVQTAMLFDFQAREDLVGLGINSNFITNATQPDAIGIDLTTEAGTDGQFGISTIANNNFVFNGANSTGIELDLGTATRLDLLSNSLTFLNDGGTGISAAVSANSLFQISDNLIDLANPVIGNIALETGIDFFRTTGLYTIFGNQNNLVLGTARTWRFVAPVSGSILVNGAAVP